MFDYILYGVYIILGLILILFILYLMRTKIKIHRIYRQLRRIKDVYILKNYCINHTKMKYVLVTLKGLFIVNLINEKGIIFGSDFDKNYTIARGDKKNKIESPTLTTKDYANDLNEVCVSLGYQNIPIFIGVIYTKADTSYVSSSYQFKNGKQIRKKLRFEIAKSLEKEVLIELFNDLKNKQLKEKDIEIVYDDSRYNER